MMAQVYLSEPTLGQPRQFFRSMLRDVWNGRELALYLFIRNMRAQHRSSALGYLWIVLQPLASAAVWLGLAFLGIFNLGQASVASYPLYVIIGTLLWQTFFEALTNPTAQLASGHTLVTKVNFPREALLMAGIGEVLVNVAARLVVVVIAVLLLQASLAPTILLAPVGFLALVALGLALGLVLLPLGLLYGDVQRAVAVMSGPLFLLTPVVWVVPSSGPVANWAFVNPIAVLLVSSRDLILTGGLTHVGPFAGVMVATTVLLMFGWVLFRVSLPHVIARMPSR